MKEKEEGGAVTPIAITRESLVVALVNIKKFILDDFNSLPDGMEASAHYDLGVMGGINLVAREFNISQEELDV
jgi:hypothetical protein